VPTILDVGRLLVVRCADRCEWCDRTGGEIATTALLVSAGGAVALFAFCSFYRIVLDDECDADLHWIDVS